MSDVRHKVTIVLRGNAVKSEPGVGSPRAGKRVRVEGRSEDFIVLRVDAERQTADLLSEGHVRQIVEDVPWLILRGPAQPNEDDIN